MIKLLLVGFGGFLGSVSRYLVGGLVHKLGNHYGFPYGTLIVNVLGCFVIGVIGGVSQSKHILAEEMHLFFLVGLLGGFTTFSSFSYETVLLAKNFQMLVAFLNVLLHVSICLGAAWVGHYIMNS